MSEKEPDYSPPGMNAEENVVWEQLSEPARKALMELDLRIRPVAAAKRLWERSLVAADRQRLGGEVEDVWRTKGTLGMWMEVRNLTNRFVAVAEIGPQLNFLTSHDHEWLVRETSLAVAPPNEAAPRPQWDAAVGSLMYDGQQIRRVRIFKTPSNVQQILQAFQNAGWSPTVPNPLDTPHDPQQLHLAVHKLNDSLQKIRFSASGGVQFVSWKRID